MRSCELPITNRLKNHVLNNIFCSNDLPLFGFIVYILLIVLLFINIYITDYGIRFKHIVSFQILLH